MTSFKRARSLVGLPIAAILLFSVFAAPKPAEATTITFTFVDTFNGTDATSAIPWLTVAFTDLALNQVEMTITSSLEVPSEFLDSLAFNTLIPLTSFAFSSASGTWQTVFDAACPPNTGWCYEQSANALSAAGSGVTGTGFDLLLEMANGSPRFDGADVGTFLLQGTGLTAASFNTSTAQGRFISAHIQGIPCTTELGCQDGTISGASEGVLAVPEPGALTLFGLGLFGVATVARRRWSKAKP